MQGDNNDSPSRGDGETDSGVLFDPTFESEEFESGDEADEPSGTDDGSDGSGQGLELFDQSLPVVIAAFVVASSFVGVVGAVAGSPAATADIELNMGGSDQAASSASNLQADFVVESYNASIEDETVTVTVEFNRELSSGHVILYDGDGNRVDRGRLTDTLAGEHRFDTTFEIDGQPGETYRAVLDDAEDQNGESVRNPAQYDATVTVSGATATATPTATATATATPTPTATATPTDIATATPTATETATATDTATATATDTATDTATATETATATDTATDTTTGAGDTESTGADGGDDGGLMSTLLGVALVLGVIAALGWMIRS
jgi:hypothetical protein